MQKRVLAAVLAAAFAPLGAMAEVTGASVGYDYTSLAENGMSGYNKSELNGAMEYSFGSALSMQGDMALRVLDGTKVDSQGLTLHTIVRPGGGATALGFFAGKDWVDGKGMEFYGLEGAGQMGAISYDAALTHVDGRNADANGLSLRGAYALSDRFDLGGRFDGYRASGETLSRYAATAGLAISPGLKMTGELGRFDTAGRDTETYIGLGVKATFGGSGGATFGKRGFMDFAPAY